MQSNDANKLIYDLIQLSDFAFEHGNDRLARNGYRHAISFLLDDLEDDELKAEIDCFLDDAYSLDSTLGDFFAEQYWHSDSPISILDDIFNLEQFFGGLEWRRNILVSDISLTLDKLPDFESYLDFASLLAQADAEDEAKDIIVDALDTFSASALFDHHASLIREEMGHYKWCEELIQRVSQQTG